MLQLEIEFLTGVARLARDPSDPEPDWPPQPDRVFSALVASWGALGEPPAERAALEWLEKQPTPDVFAIPDDQTAARPMVDVYVPVNDETAPKRVPEKAKAIAGALAVLPARRTRQKRGFQVCALPEAHTHVRLFWPVDPPRELLPAMESLARATSYLGHSASLVRLRFSQSANAANAMCDATGLTNSAARAVPYDGRLLDLERLHRRHIQGDGRARPRPSPHIAAREPVTPRGNVFSPDWLVLSHVGGDRPDLLAAAAIARRMRDALMSALPQPVPDWVSGHSEDRTPLRTPHMAIAPLANVGWEHADGRLMGLAVILPAAVRATWDDQTPAVWKARRDFEGAFAKLTKRRDEKNTEEEEPAILLHLGKAGIWRLAVDPAPTAASLRPDRYIKTAKIFHTVTPIALDKHLKEDGEAARAEAEALIADACANIGLPRPRNVAIYKHSAVRGAPSAWPASGAPKYPTWARPKFLAGRKIVHARITFETAVEGPVLLGAGRFAGLGLCLPAPESVV